MSTKRVNGNGTAVVAKPVTKEETGDFKFTLNLRSEFESLTIRTNSQEELETQRAIWKHQIIPQKKKKPYLRAGDPCGECQGVMILQTGRNRKTQEEYEFLGCSAYPDCEFSSYVARDTQGT